MEKINPEEWKKFSEVIREHWPNIDEEELKGTEGYYEMVKQLIENKSMNSEYLIKKELKEIFKSFNQ